MEWVHELRERRRQMDRTRGGGAGCQVICSSMRSCRSALSACPLSLSPPLSLYLYPSLYLSIYLYLYPSLSLSLSLFPFLAFQPPSPFHLI
jgi:hypothetical protein